MRGEENEKLGRLIPLLDSVVDDMIEIRMIDRGPSIEGYRMVHDLNSETALKNFNSYIEAFNGCNIDVIIQQLDPDVEVEFNGSVASRGRDTILPDYLSDFKIGKYVEIVRGPLVKDKGATVDIDVTFIATTPGVEAVQLDVLYTYDVGSMTQVRHIITNVKTLSSESTE